MMNNTYSDFYSGSEKRIAAIPRRITLYRRHRTRTESLVSDCRILFSRRNEDEEGYIEMYTLSDDEASLPPGVQPQIEK